MVLRPAEKKIVIPSQKIITPDKQPFVYKGTKYNPEELEPLKKSNLADQRWRLNNLYNILDEDGDNVIFKLRPAQKAFLDAMWYRNVILKSRQHGFSTLIDILLLDWALFIPNIKVVIIAHKKSAAEEIMSTKVEYPLTNLHPEIHALIGLVEQNKSTLSFTNGSSIHVLTSGRSGTSQALHVSELGYTARHRPDIAEEIITGSIPSVHQNGFVFVESTADGREGEFFDMASKAFNAKKERKKLTRIAFKGHFYAWQDKPDNRLSEADCENVEIPYRLEKYFDQLERDEGITIDEAQRKWYVEQEDILGDKMQREHPSTPKEAFDSSGEGHYFSVQMDLMRTQDRITTVPHEQGRLVHSFWDIGVNDEMAIWYMQRVGKQWNAIHYVEDTDFGLDHYIRITNELARDEKWALGEWWAPHDIKKRAIINAVTVHRQAQDLGVSFKVVPKVDEKSISITACRRSMSLLHIDSERCEEGIERLDNYRKEWDSIRGTWKDKPRHDRNSNGADALQTWAMHLEREAIENSMGGARKDPTRKNRSPIDRDVAGKKPNGAFRKRTSNMRAHTV